MYSENTLRCIESRMSHARGLGSNNADTAGEPLNHTFDDCRGKVSTSLTEFGSLVTDGVRKLVHELDDGIGTGVQNLRDVLGYPCDEVDANARCFVDDLSDVVGDTMENSGKKLESGVHHLRNVLRQRLKHLGQHLRQSVDDLRCQCSDSRYECFENHRDPLGYRRSCRSNDLSESDDTLTDLLHHLRNKTDQPSHDPDDCRGSSSTCRSKSRKSCCEQEYASSSRQQPDAEKCDRHTKPHENRDQWSEHESRQTENDEDACQHRETLQHLTPGHLSKLLENWSQNVKSRRDDEKRQSTRKSLGHEDHCACDKPQRNSEGDETLGHLLPTQIPHLFESVSERPDRQRHDEQCRRTRKRFRHEIHCACDDAQGTGQSDQPLGYLFPTHSPHVLESVANLPERSGNDQNCRG